MLTVASILIVLCNISSYLDSYPTLPILFFISFGSSICSLLIARSIEIVAFIVSNHDVTANRVRKPEEPDEDANLSLGDHREAA